MRKSSAEYVSQDSDDDLKSTRWQLFVCSFDHCYIFSFSWQVRLLNNVEIINNFQYTSKTDVSPFMKQKVL